MKNVCLPRLILVINILFISSVNNAQTPSVDHLNEVMENISVNNEDEKDINWENELIELSEHIEQPINLNTVTKEQLEQFPFLSDIQIENILAYLYIHGQMQTIYELQLVEEMDRETIHYLLPFVSVHFVDKPVKISLKNIFNYGKHEILTRFDIPFYTRKGYEKSYLGPAIYHSLKYAFRYRENVYAGFIGEKDAGEPFCALHNKQGYDHYSYYLFIKDMNRWLKTLALGNYRLNFGQGLVVNSDFLLGKTSYVSSFGFRSSGIRKHSSTDEYNYFSGVAVTLGLIKELSLSAFYSNRSLDGVLEGNEITSIYKTGLHRSKKEADKSHVFNLQLTGGNLSFVHNYLKLGLTGIYYVFNHPYEPELKEYSKYSLHGNSFYNMGFNYSYRWHRFSFQGEAAIGKKGSAFLNRLEYSPIQGYQLMLVHRYYACDYWAMFAHSFGEGSTVQNENGWYLAAEISPFRYWKFFASLDLFSFPWWKYRISKPSQGIESRLRTTFSPGEAVNMYLDYQYKQMERDVAGTSGKQILPTSHHRLRYRLNYHPEGIFSFRTTFNYNYFCLRNKKSSQGYQITQTGLFHSSQLPFEVALQGSYFHTDDYDSRVYIAEKGLLYTFYTPSFQGKGVRLTGSIRYDINKHWVLITKFGETFYFNQNEIGSGDDLIRSNKKADLQMQLRLKF